METLLDDYKRKLETAERMLKENEADQRIMTKETCDRVTTKAGLYRSFIVDIKRAMARMNIKTGVTRSTCCGAQLLPFPIYGYDECISCGKTYKHTEN